MQKLAEPARPVEDQVPHARRSRPRRVAVVVGIVAAVLLLVLTVVIAVSARRTEAVISGERTRITAAATAAQPFEFDAGQIAELPEPVRRWVRFTFPTSPPAAEWVEMTMEGDFRRPQTETFAPTTAEQTAAITLPAFVFSATTPVGPGMWARAYDAFGEGEMDMRAKIMSTLTVVDERGTAELNRISLRRWLMEAPLYPMALLPGGHVRWEPIDDDRARAVVSADGLDATAVVTFRADGSIERIDAEQDGDLDTPYHGSGEHALREDYRPVDGVMIPHRFVMARVAAGQTYPFWEGRIVSIDFRGGS